MNILESLFANQDNEYADFQAKLTPTIDRDRFIGVRVPVERKIAKEVYKSGDYEDFLNDLPHRYYEEDMLSGLIICELKDYNDCISHLERFLPYVNNWAVCDCMSPKCFKKNRPDLINRVMEWMSSSEVYTIRFGIGTLMGHFLDEDFDAKYLEAVALIRSEEYYVNMMIAWFFATALAKQWDATIPYIENKKLDTWVHNKTIQKARESFRVSDEQKEYLKSLKIITKA